MRGVKAKWELSRLDVRSLFALRTLLHFERNLLSFLKRFKALCLNFGEMSEEVLAAIVRGDKAKALGVIEPLHSTCCHFR